MPCVSTAFRAKTAPLPCVSIAFRAKAAPCARGLSGADDSSIRGLRGGEAGVDAPAARRHALGGRDRVTHTRGAPCVAALSRIVESQQVFQSVSSSHISYTLRPSPEAPQQPTRPVARPAYPKTTPVAIAPPSRQSHRPPARTSYCIAPFTFWISALDRRNKRGLPSDKSAQARAAVRQ